MDDVLLLQAIYSRLTIRIGKEKTKCNTGVAQGSMVSPALFDLYAEELIQKLIEYGWSFEDILAFADDHLIICDPVEEIKKAILIAKLWCDNANITLNPNKSGILEITSRRSKQVLKFGESIEEMPIVSPYKYLGVELDCKLTGEIQVCAMNKKIHFLNYRLAPLLSRVSLGYRINLWKILIKPLFNSSIALMARNNQTRIKILEKNFKTSLKKFVGFYLSTEDSVINKLIDFDVCEMSRKQEEVALARWRQRLFRSPYIIYVKENKKTNTPLLPKAFTKYVNIQKTKCHLCGNSQLNSAHYLKEFHKILVPKSLESIAEWLRVL